VGGEKKNPKLNTKGNLGKKKSKCRQGVVNTRIERKRTEDNATLCEARPCNSPPGGAGEINENEKDRKRTHEELKGG